MSDRGPIHQRSTVGYIAVSLFVALVAALFIPPLVRFFARDGTKKGGTQVSTADVSHERPTQVLSEVPRSSSQTDASRTRSPANPSQGNANVKPAMPEVSRLDIRDIDPHTCEKPDDAYFGRWGPARPAPAGSGELKNPEFLFDTRHEEKETAINWARGFKGRVPVCLVINQKGNPTEIRFLQSPGADLEERVKTKILGWRYKPGTLTQNWRDDPKPISVQLAMEFIFQ